MDDQLNDEVTCGSIDSHSHGINITPRVGKRKILTASEMFVFV